MNSVANFNMNTLDEDIDKLTKSLYLESEDLYDELNSKLTNRVFDEMLLFFATKYDCLAIIKHAIDNKIINVFEPSKHKTYPTILHHLIHVAMENNVSNVYHYLTYLEKNYSEASCTSQTQPPKKKTTSPESNVIFKVRSDPRKKNKDEINDNIDNDSYIAADEIDTGNRNTNKSKYYYPAYDSKNDYFDNSFNDFDNFDENTNGHFVFEPYVGPNLETDESLSFDSRKPEDKPVNYPNYTSTKLDSQLTSRPTHSHSDNKQHYNYKLDPKLVSIHSPNVDYNNTMYKDSHYNYAKKSRFDSLYNSFDESYEESFDNSDNEHLDDFHAKHSEAKHYEDERSKNPNYFISHNTRTKYSDDSGYEEVNKSNHIDSKHRPYSQVVYERKNDSKNMYPQVHPENNAKPQVKHYPNKNMYPEIPPDNGINPQVKHYPNKKFNYVDTQKDRPYFEEHPKHNDMQNNSAYANENFEYNNKAMNYSHSNKNPYSNIDHERKRVVYNNKNGPRNNMSNQNQYQNQYNNQAHNQEDNQVPEIICPQCRSNIFDTGYKLCETIEYKYSYTENRPIEIYRKLMNPIICSKCDSVLDNFTSSYLQQFDSYDTCTQCSAKLTDCGIIDKVNLAFSNAKNSFSMRSTSYHCSKCDKALTKAQIDFFNL